MSKKLQIRIGLAVVFVLGLVLAATPWSTWIPTERPMLQYFFELVTKVGDALMIAPILAAIVEIAVTRELLEDFVYGISHHIVGRLLPSELREHILRYLTTDFVRTRWTIEYHLEELPDHPDYVQLRRISEYDLENRSVALRKFDFRFEIQRSWFPRIGEASIKMASCQLNGINQFEYRGQDIANRIATTEGMIIFSQAVDIPGGSKGTYTFTTESTEILPINYETTLIAGIPTVHATVKVQCSLQRFKTALRLSSGDDHDLPRKTLDHGVHWTVNSPILTGQCLLLRWASIPDEQQT